MLERYHVPANAIQMESPRGKTVQWLVTPQIVLQVGSGHGDVELARMMTAGLARAMNGKSKVVCFFDGLEFSGYDPDFRMEMASATRRLMGAGQFAMLHLLTRSKLVAMGVAVVNLAVNSSFQVYSTAETFDRALTKLGGGAALAKAPR